LSRASEGTTSDVKLPVGLTLSSSTRFVFTRESSYCLVV